MRLIERTDYLSKLISLKNTPDIKVITGIRRSGKSKLLQQYIQYLQNEDSNYNIVFVDYNDIDYDFLKNYKKLNTYVMDRYKDDKKNYLFIDEVQMCENFELTINSLHNKEIFDMYITGSNAFLLSSDLATLFTGRTMQVEVYPFSFLEYKQYYSDVHLSDYEMFDKYLIDGGLPGSYPYVDDFQRKSYIKSAYDTILNRDLLEKYMIKDIEILNNLSDYMMDNISNLTSPNKICNQLIAKSYKTSHKTIGNYIKYLCNAFMFYKIKRYDLKGKKYLETSEKYYLADHAFRSANLGVRNIDYGRVYENIVLIELLRRGYNVYIGKLYEKEIDFVATKLDSTLYIQVSSNIEDEDTFKREVSPLLSINNAYPKIVIARTLQPEYQYEGIKIMDLSHWLSKRSI